MKRVRTFVAVELSPGVCRRAGELISLLRGAEANVNWVRPQHMHLTLKFLGDVPDNETPDVCRVVREVASQFEPFEIVCRGAGAFPSLANPRTLWIGIADGGDELLRLHQELDAALAQRLGFARERRGFHPHLTIGRVKHLEGPARDRLAELLAAQAEFDADLAVLDEVVTFASFLGRGGPTHEPLDRAGLGES